MKMAAAVIESQDENIALDSNNAYYQTDQVIYETDEISNASVQNKAAESIPEEDCWLFKPSKTSVPFLSNASCLIWAREVFDSPSSQFYQRRRDLLNRLELILATEPFKRFPNLGGSVPSLISNVVTNNSSTISKSRGFGGSSNQNFGPGSNATFVRPRRHASDVIPPQQQQKQLPQPATQHSRQRSSPIPFKLGTSPGSTDDLQNVADLRSMARKQEDELKAEVAAISAHQYASRSGGSQQSLNRSGPESPYNSQPRLNISPSPTPGDIAKQQMAALRLSLDSQRHAPALGHRIGSGSSDENLVLGGEANITSPGFGQPFTNNYPSSLRTQQAVIVGRPLSKSSSRLPTPMTAIRRGPRFPSNETLPSFTLGDNSNLPICRNSQEQLAPPRRIPMPPPRSGSSFSYQQ